MHQKEIILKEEPSRNEYKSILHINHGTYFYSVTSPLLDSSAPGAGNLLAVLLLDRSTAPHHLGLTPAGTGGEG